MNASYYSTSYAAGPKNNNSKLCAELLLSLQNKISRGLKNELLSARGNKTLTVFLLVPQTIAENNSTYSAQSTNIPLRRRLQQFGIEVLNSHAALAEKTYLEVRGTKTSILTLMKDFKARETFLGVSELEWAGLGKRKPVDPLDTTISKTASADLKTERYILMFDSHESFDQARAKLQELGISVLENFVRRSNGKVTLILQTTETVFEIASKLPGIEMAEKDSQSKLANSGVRAQ